MPGSLVENIYYRLPVILQDSVFSAYGLHLSRIRYNEHFHVWLRRLKEMQWWGVEAIKKYQDRQVSFVVRFAYNTVPFYKELYDFYGVNVRDIKSVSDLKYLPIVTKQMVRENHAKMLSSSFLKRDLRRNLTSGTTGTPLSIFFSREGLAFQWAVWWRHKSRFGLSVKDRYLAFGARVPISQNQKRSPYWRNDYFNNRVYLSSYHISRQTVADIVKYLNNNYFDFYAGYPSSMYALASLMDYGDLRLRNSPKMIVTGSDALTPRYQEMISRVFGASVTEQYGMTEFAGNMSKCEYGVFHEDYECSVVETIPIDDTGYSNIVLTGWGNLAMPFIRYEVGDLGTPFVGVCACGRESKAFVRVDGRNEDYLTTPSGRKIMGMNQVFEYAKNAMAIQLYQKTVDCVEFRVVPGKGYGDEDEAALKREFNRRVGSENICISICLVKEIETSRSGKIKAVVSEVE